MPSYKYLLTSLCLLASLTLASAVQADTQTSINPGDLIKASGPTVYYFGADQKRYVFPNAKTYFTWYADFSGVKTISDHQLAGYSLGGNVTYKPGAKLVKITTDPKVYAVSHGGNLRWIQSETLAAALYGGNWSSQVDDIPDAYFINYSVGTAVATSTDYVRSLETALALSINVDKNLSQPPGIMPPANPAAATSSTPATPTMNTTTTTATPTASPYLATISSSKTNPQPGDVITLNAQAGTNAMLNAVNILFDGSPVRRCEFTPCTADVTIPLSGTKSSYDIRADVSWLDGKLASATSSLPVAASGNSSVKLSVTQPEIKPNGSREVVVNVNGTFSVKFIDIYLDGTDIKSCVDVVECRYSGPETSATGTVHSVYAIARNSYGEQRQSDTKTISVVDNPRPVVKFIQDKTSIFHGENIDVALQATSDAGIAWTEIWLDGAMLKHCSSISCTQTTGPWPQPRSLTFIGKAQDINGFIGYGTSTPVTVQ